MKIGLFGGTFDPPHTGHLIVAQDARLALGFDRVLFVPAAHPPHKPTAAVSPSRLRARMLALAIEGDAGFDIDSIELNRSGPSYTVDTLRELTVLRPGIEWTLLVGADQYEEFSTWREPDEIRRLARVAVLSREGTPGGTGALTAGDVRIDVTRIDISATAVRRRVAAGLPIRYLVPAAVEAFIHEHRLYGRNGTRVTG